MFRLLGGDRIRNKTTVSLKGKGYSIYATLDWQPKDSTSFYTSHKGKKPPGHHRHRRNDSGTVAIPLRSRYRGVKNPPK
jgi:hypothetical protein